MTHSSTEAAHTCRDNHPPPSFVAASPAGACKDRSRRRDAGRPGSAVPGRVKETWTGSGGKSRPALESCRGQLERDVLGESRSALRNLIKKLVINLTY